MSLALSVWLTQVISRDLHFPCVWLKASCVKAVQIKTACHSTLSSTLLHGNSSPVSSALPLRPGCLSAPRTGISSLSLFCTRGNRKAHYVDLLICGMTWHCKVPKRRALALTVHTGPFFDSKYLAQQFNALKTIEPRPRKKAWQQTCKTQTVNLAFTSNAGKQG